MADQTPEDWSSLRPSSNAAREEGEASEEAKTSRRRSKEAQSFILRVCNGAAGY